MRNTSHWVASTAILLFTWSTADAAQGRAADKTGNIGTVTMEISCADPAKPAFTRGMALLHSFVWDEARKQFQTARDTDPTCAIASWGEAMSYYDGLHEPPGEKEIAAAREAIAAALAATSATPREKLYVAAARALFDEYPKPSRLDRDRAYNKAMQAIVDEYPDDEDAAALYALSLLAIARRGAPDGYDLQMKSAASLAKLLEAHPGHPGAAHYLIHACDDSGERERGLGAARAYAKIAPAVTHALHMPTHIFAGLGMWDETIASNKAAYEASDRIVQERGQPLSRRYYHGVLYWLYALIQKGDEAGARALLAEHQPLLEGGDTAAKASLHNLLARWYLDTDRAAEAANMPVLVDRPLEKAEALFVRGLGQARTKQLDAADASHRQMQEIVAEVERAKDLDVGVRARILQVQAKQLEAAILVARGKNDAAVKLLKETVALEDAPGVSWAPPDAGTGLPAHEFFAEALLQLGKRKEAAAEFEKALKKTPGRRRSIQGLARAKGRS